MLAARGTPVARTTSGRTYTACAAPRPARVAVRSAAPEAASAAAVAAEAPPSPITLTERAVAQLRKLRAESPNSGAMLLRVGVKQGGCSGMSYVMDFEDSSKISDDDMVVPYEGGELSLAIDPKSLLYLFGLKLDYSDALIGGGFKFENPNATDNCGCGKSFGV